MSMPGRTPSRAIITSVLYAMYAKCCLMKQFRRLHAVLYSPDLTTVMQFSTVPQSHRSTNSRGLGTIWPEWSVGEVGSLMQDLSCSLSTGWKSCTRQRCWYTRHSDQQLQPTWLHRICFNYRHDSCGPLVQLCWVCRGQEQSVYWRLVHSLWKQLGLPLGTLCCAMFDHPVLQTLLRRNWKLLCLVGLLHRPICTRCGKKWTPKVSRCFLSNRLEFKFEILQIYLLKPSTSKCQVKCDSVKKLRSYRLYHDCLPFFQHSKTFRLQHQFNNVLETT